MEGASSDEEGGGCCGEDGCRPLPRPGELADPFEVDMDEEAFWVSSSVFCAASSSAPPPAPDPTAEAKRLEAANLAAVKKAAEEKAAAEARAEADRKAAAAKKAAEAKKAADAKAAAEKAARAKAEKEAKANPSRIWVQVAGGANRGDLPRAWAQVKAKAPDAFRGKTGWSTPLNATNRVLAGPFKTGDEAQDFVNQLAKKGISAFPFTSVKGQKVDKLPAK